MEPRTPHTKMLCSFYYIHYKGQNGERKAMSAWKLCPLIGLAPVTTEGSLLRGAKEGCGVWKAQLGAEPDPGLSSSMCAAQGRQELGKKPSVSQAWAERENVGAPWGRWRPEESKERKAGGLGHWPRGSSQKIPWDAVIALTNTDTSHSQTAPRCALCWVQPSSGSRCKTFRNSQNITSISHRKEPSEEKCSPKT